MFEDFVKFVNENTEEVIAMIMVAGGSTVVSFTNKEKSGIPYTFIIGEDQIGEMRDLILGSELITLYDLSSFQVMRDEIEAGSDFAFSVRECITVGNDDNPFCVESQPLGTDLFEPEFFSVQMAIDGDLPFVVGDFRTAEDAEDAIVWMQELVAR